MNEEKRYFEVVRKEMRKFDEVLIKLPKRATKTSAGYDIYSPIDCVIKSGEAKLIWTDVKVHCLKDEFVLVCVTSGMGKRGAIISSGIGVVDADYFSNSGNDGNIGVNIHNHSEDDYVIKVGDKIGQCIFMKYLTVDNETEIQAEREGGFGSTNNF